MKYQRLFSGLIIAGLFGATVAGCGKKDDNDEPAEGGSGGVSTGGVSTGGVRTGGTNTGGTNTGGTRTGGTTSGGTGTGGAAGGETGGTAGQGGEGGAGTGAPCADALFVPFTEAGQGADFEIDYGVGGVDLSGTTLSVTLRVESAGNAGGLQVYVKNGEAQSWASSYQGWNNLSDLTEWTTLTYDLSAITPTGSFDPTAIQWVGVNVAAGDGWEGATWGDTTVYVDSITFSDGATPNLDFNSGEAVLSINAYSDPAAPEGTAVTPADAACEVPGGTGGAGGSAGAPSTGGTAGTAGAAGAAGTPGAAGTAGAAGAPATGPTGLASFFTPLAAADTGTDFEVDVGSSALVDLSGSIITVNMKAITTGNAGGFQFYLKNGADQSYATQQFPWTNLSAVADWTELTFDLADITTPAAGFDATQVRWIGFAVRAGGTWEGATWADTTLLVDSITFSDGALPNFLFNTDEQGFAINIYNTTPAPVTGSLVDWLASE